MRRALARAPLNELRVAVPILIFAIALAAGVGLVARWLPDLGEGRVSMIAFFVTCGLAGVALALIAVHGYEIVRQVNNAAGGGLGNANPDIVASGIVDTLRDAGSILGLSPASLRLTGDLPVARSPGTPENRCSMGVKSVSPARPSGPRGSRRFFAWN